MKKQNKKRSITITLEKLEIEKFRTNTLGVGLSAFLNEKLKEFNRVNNLKIEEVKSYE